MNAIFLCVVSRSVLRGDNWVFHFGACCALHSRGIASQDRSLYTVQLHHGSHHGTTHCNSRYGMGISKVFSFYFYLPSPLPHSSLSPPSPGPLVARAAIYTAGVVGGLTLTAACAPSEKYLHMGGPLSLGLGVVLVASLGESSSFPTDLSPKTLITIIMFGLYRIMPAVVYLIPS